MTTAMNTAFKAWAVGLVLLGAASCVREPDPPPLPTDLEERTANLVQVKKRLEEIKVADVETAVANLGHADHRVRRAALLRLGELKDKAKGELAAIVAMLEDPHPRVRTAATRALADIGDENAVTALSEKIMDPEPAVRRWTWKALLRFGEPSVKVLVPRLAKNVQNGDDHFLDEAGRKQYVRGTLRTYLPLFEEKAVPTLTEALASNDNWLRTNAANVLGQIGDKSAPAVPKLIWMLETDDDRDARYRAAQALGSIGGTDPDPIPALEAAVKDKEKKVAKAARQSLKTLKKAAEEAAKKKADLEKRNKLKQKAQAKKGEKKKAPPPPQGPEDDDIEEDSL